MGIEAPIECFGVFPPNTNPKKDTILHGRGALDTAIDNYLSMKDQPEDAEIETERLIGLGYLSRVPKPALDAIVGNKGKPARLALIVKEKADGSRKRRVIVDHKRNGGNDRATVPERPVLPRVIDAIMMLIVLMRTALAAQIKMTLVAMDFSDAYFHFLVRPSEWKYCLAAHVRAGVFLLWANLPFGLRSAPLLWSRFAAWLGRMLAAIIPAGMGSVQVYMDDPLFVLIGPAERRVLVKSCLLHFL